MQWACMGIMQSIYTSNLFGSFKKRFCLPPSPVGRFFLVALFLIRYFFIWIQHYRHSGLQKFFLNEFSISTFKLQLGSKDRFSPVVTKGLSQTWPPKTSMGLQKNVITPSEVWVLFEYYATNRCQRRWRSVSVEFLALCSIRQVYWIVR